MKPILVLDTWLFFPELQGCVWEATPGIQVFSSLSSSFFMTLNIYCKGLI